ncbi:MAG TPA: hypothetical protein VI999_00905 [Thermoplasmata archaeon]|nr:hypothetical protein [Thermoplasmata archaeon]
MAAEEEPGGLTASGAAPETPTAGRAKPRVDWIMGIAFGLPAALGTAVAWALVAAATGYVFALGAILIGVVVAYAVRRGAKRVTWAVITMSIAFTILAVFLGDVLALTIILVGAGFDVGPLDIIAYYPELLALAPVDALITYVFGLLGAGYGARWLYRQMRAQTAAEHPSWAAQPSAASAARGVAPKTEILDQGPARAAARLSVPMSPSHTIEASFGTLDGLANVRVDGSTHSEDRVTSGEKFVQVPLDGDPPRVLNLRFYASGRPRIEFRLDGILVGEV